MDPNTRLPAPRYWLLHSLSDALIREMAMSSGYGAAGLTERIYGWSASPQREAAAGLLICTTASDSEGGPGYVARELGGRGVAQVVVVQCVMNRRRLPANRAGSTR